MGSGGAEYNTALGWSRDPNAHGATPIPVAAGRHADLVHTATRGCGVSEEEGAQETVGATGWPRLPRNPGYCSVLYLVS